MTNLVFSLTAVIGLIGLSIGYIILQDKNKRKVPVKIRVKRD